MLGGGSSDTGDGGGSGGYGRGGETRKSCLGVNCEEMKKKKSKTPRKGLRG